MTVSPVASRTSRLDPEIPELHLRTGRAGHWLVVTAEGSVHGATAARLRAGLRAALDESLLVAVDLAAAELTDVSGFGVLVGVNRSARAQGRVFLVVAAAAPVVRILRTNGLDHDLLLCTTLPGLIAR
ncbi:hypothetical protein GCM10027589_41580 [Actinocorallia lasiicapitis]